MRRFGQAPSDATIREIASWLESRADDGVFVADRLPKLLETQAGLEDSATGLLAVAISPAHGDYVLWFRASTETVVDWAGHPYKNVQLPACHRVVPSSSGVRR